MRRFRGPGRPRKAHGLGSSARRSRKLHKEPWLLATSLPVPDLAGARRIIALYASRMQIEEAFRDTKGHRWGFALAYARTRTAARLEVLLLVAALSAFMQWLAGLTAKARNWTRRFQANTTRNRAVLSTVFLGHAALNGTRLRTSINDLLGAIQAMPRFVAEQNQSLLA